MIQRLPYSAFLERKSQVGHNDGFDPAWMPEFLYDFQAALVEWAVRKGRAAIFADCGLGKTPMQLVWAENVVRHTRRPVLILTPPAVGPQTVREAEKFGIEATLSRDGTHAGGIVVTNYERLHYFDPSEFAGVVCDESSILKNFLGVTRKAITEFLRTLRYRLLCTATAAPNDFIELGTSSEALGYLGHMDMLAQFFKNDDNTIFLMGQKYGDLTQKGWRFKAHAETHFWRWVCSWARACRKPSDLGEFCDDRFNLPPLDLREVTVEARTLAPGRLFDAGAVTLKEQQEEQRRTYRERCEKVAEILADEQSAAVAWAHLNSEGDLLTSLIPGAVQVSGKDADEKKEELFLAFAEGQIKNLVTKPKIGGFGLNWQHCARQTFFPSHSFEQWHQCISRSRRFGQKRRVRVDMVASEGAEGIASNLKRKMTAMDELFSQLVRFMGQHQHVQRSTYGFNPTEVPLWLSSNPS